MSEPTTYTLQVPDAVLVYEVRDNGGSTHPVLLLVGAPMGASGFAALAEQFTDRVVVTYDPRGTERSQRTDREPPGSPPGEHAEDLRRLHMTACVGHQFDFDALRSAPTRILLGVGTQSGQMMAGRAALAVADRLGVTPVTFPGGHDGFLTDPAAFAAVLRTALDS